MKSELAFYGGDPTLSSSNYSEWPSPCKEDLIALKKVTEGKRYHRVNNPIVIELEKNLKTWLKCQGVRSVNTGTSAIHIAMDYYKKKNKFVLVSALNWPSAVSTIYLAGMQPLYVDVDLQTGNMCENDVLCKNSDAVVGILVTHLFGNLAYLEHARRKVIVEDRKFIIDDCSQGVKIAQYLSNSDCECYTNAVVFSGNGAKHLASGELGVLATDDMKLIDYVDYVSLSSSSRNGERTFSPFTLGYNYRTNVFSAAVANSRLLSVDVQIEERQRNVNYLYAKVKELSGLYPIFNINDLNNNYYGMPFRIDFAELEIDELAKLRDFIVELLRSEGVPATVWLKKPVWEYLDYKRTNCDLCDFPNTHKLLSSMFYITEIAPPNDYRVMDLYALAIHKVWSYVIDNYTIIKDICMQK